MNTNQLIGLLVEDAESIITKAGFNSRIVYEDGQHFAVTCDYRLDRVNLHVERGLIVKANIG